MLSPYEYIIEHKNDKKYNIICENIIHEYEKYGFISDIDCDIYLQSIFDYVLTDNKKYGTQQIRYDSKYKKEVKERYKNTCVISGTTATVQVCHIKPFSESNDDEKYDVYNGILLRDDIHILFDRGDIKINSETLKVEISDKIMRDKKNKCYHKFNGKILNLVVESKKYLKFKC